MIFRMMILLCWIYKVYLYKIRKFGNSEELWFYLWIGIWTGNTFLLITSSFFHSMDANKPAFESFHWNPYYHAFAIR